MHVSGRHRPAHSLQSLGKGTFRAALAANEKFGDKMPVYIVPAGIEYGDYFRYRSTSLLTFGEPINVTEFVKGLDVENQAQMIEPLRKELAARMSGLITFLKDDENLYVKWALTRIVAAANGLNYGNFGTSLYDGMTGNREIVQRIEAACEEKAEQMQKLLEKVDAFEKKRKKKGMSIYSFTKKNTPLRAVGKALAALIGLPYYIFSTTVSSPMWLTYYLLKSKTRDKAFHNTVGFGIKLGLGLVLYPVYTALAFCFMKWQFALAALLLSIPSYSFFFDYNEGIRRLVSDIRVLADKKMRSICKDIVKSFKKL